MLVIRKSMCHDVGRDEENEQTFRDDVGLILETLAWDIRRRTERVDIKLPFDIHFEVVRDGSTWEVRGTTTLEWN